MSLRWRLILGVALIELILLSFLVLGLVEIVRETSREGVDIEAQSSNELFATAATSAVMTYDLATLEALLGKVSQQPNISFARVYDVKGEELAGFGDLPPDSASTEQTSELLVSTVDIVNDALIVGRFTAGYNLNRHESIVASAYSWGLFAGLAKVLVVILATLFLFTMLTRELQNLRERSRTLSLGDIDTPLPTHGTLPEVRTIAHALESMRLKVGEQLRSLQRSNDALRHESEQKELALHSEREHAQKNAQVFAVLGHEIRTPIALAIMLIRDPDKRLNSGPILANLNHALELVDDLNISSHSQAQPTKYERYEMSSFIQELNIGLKPLFDASSLSFSQAGLEGEDRLVELPTKELRQIVRNLVKNACVHSGGTEVRLHAELRTSSPTEAKLRLSVEDDGQGIAQADRERVFEPFVKLKSDTAGSGLGLSVCRELANSIGATFELGSSEAGTRFTLTLNVQLANADTAVQQDNSAEQPNLLEGKRLLVVEDNLTIQLLTKKVLTTAGAVVTVAKDGLHALEHFADHFDLVLTDIHMPNMDGIELTRELRSRGHTGPIVGVTAATIGEESEALIGAGANSCLGKPFDLRKLQALLPNLMRTEG